MNRIPCRSSWPAAFLILLTAAVGSGPLADEEAPARIAPRALEERAEEFNRLVFDSRSFISVFSRLDTLLKLKVEEIRGSCNPPEERLAKLRIAGKGDIQRFFNQVVEAREEYLRNELKGPEIAELVQSLRTKLQNGLFGETSLFAKSVTKTLTAPQLDKYQAVGRERRNAQHHAKIAMVVALWDETIPLRAEQRRRLEQLLAEETQPPVVFGKNDYWVILAQAAVLPPEKFTEILGDSQWQLVRQTLDQAKKIEPELRQQRLLPQPGRPEKTDG